MRIPGRMVSAALLLGLVGLLSGASIAFAQSQEACPRPPGFPAPPPNLATAAQVENGDATLQQFVRSFGYLASLQRYSEATGYIGCLLTREGPFFSGSTYFVTMTLTGRVDLHGKNVGLSGGLLKPDIVEQITRAASSSPFGGPFMAEAANAAGYAVGGARNPDGSPAILVAGFDLQESHLVPEVTAPDDVPAVTARDVVDRASLKAFVDGAIAYFIRRFETEGYEAALKVKRVFRDPNGPWRAGPVYLFVIDLNGFTLFHGAFPEKFELQTPTDTLRDVVTGELILPRIIEAATRSLEGGGFVEYHFDNPDDDTDSAEIPKVTYADAITADAPMGAAVGSQTLIVGAGIYGDPVSEKSVASTSGWLARFGRAAAGQTVDMIGGRLSSPSSGKSQVKIAGRTLNLDDYRPSDGQAAGFATTAHVPDFWDEAEGTFRSLSARDLLLGSSFQLSSMSGKSGMGGGASIWGQAAHTGFDTGNEVSLDGSVTTGMLGADYEWGRMLAGLAVSRSIGDGGFEPAADVKSEMEASLTSVHPYFRVVLGEGMSAWGLAGYGKGGMSLKEDDIEKEVETDITMTSGALGVRGDILSVEQTGFLDVAVKSDVLLMRIESDEEDGLPSIAAEGTQVRLGVEGSRGIKMDEGGELRPSLELGMRYESGDAEQGTGFEVGGGVRYSNPGSGVSVEVRGRGLVASGGDDDYKDWGIGGSVRVQPGAMGRGFSLSLAPSWGVVSGGARSLWRQSSVALLTARGESELAGRLKVEMGYGLSMPGRALLTPYAGVTLLSEGRRDWRMGWRYNLGPSVRLSLEGVRREGLEGLEAPDHGVTVQGTVRW